MEQNALTIHELYPQLREEELKGAEDNLDRYLNLVLRIFERQESETRPQARRLISGAGTLDCTAPQSEASS